MSLASEMEEMHSTADICMIILDVLHESIGSFAMPWTYDAVAVGMVDVAKACLEQTGFSVLRYVRILEDEDIDAIGVVKRLMVSFIFGTAVRTAMGTTIHGTASKKRGEN